MIQEEQFAPPDLSDFHVQARILVGPLYVDKQ
jgi:hypothetical protein